MSGSTAGTSFAPKALRVTLQKGRGKFAVGGGNTLTIQAGRRVQFQGLAAQGGVDGISQQTAKTRIYGMSSSDMNDLYWANGGGEFSPPFNTIVVEASGNGGTTWSTVHKGVVSQAQQDFSGQPDSAFVVESYGGYDIQLLPVTPGTYKGSWSIAWILADMAAKGQMTFQDQGVPDIKASDLYFAGALRRQIEHVCSDYNLRSEIVGSTLFVWSGTTARKVQVPVIGPESGLISYPVRDAVRCEFQCIYNPLVRYMGKVTLQSSIKQVAGDWIAVTVQHTLHSETPGGLWQSDVIAMKTLVPY